MHQWSVMWLINCIFLHFLELEFGFTLLLLWGEADGKLEWNWVFSWFAGEVCAIGSFKQRFHMWVYIMAQLLSRLNAMRCLKLISYEATLSQAYEAAAVLITEIYCHTSFTWLGWAPQYIVAYILKACSHLQIPVILWSLFAGTKYVLLSWCTHSILPSGFANMSFGKSFSKSTKSPSLDFSYQIWVHVTH